MPGFHHVDGNQFRTRRKIGSLSGRIIAVVIALGLAGFAIYSYQSTHSVHSPAEPDSIAGQSTGLAPPC
jgi:hypothetical protein